MMKPTRLSNTIKEHRVELGITQAQLAEQVGVSRQTINAIEAGKYSPTLELAMLIALVVKSSVESLFTLEGDLPHRG
jgi:putative transcriptional regulator